MKLKKVETFRRATNCNNGVAMHNLAQRLFARPILAMVDIAVQCRFCVPYHNYTIASRLEWGVK
jgi:hypothetical protein